MKTLTVFLSLLVTPCALLAAETHGKIKHLYSNREGVALFTLTTQPGERPSCATNHMWDFKLDLSNPYSKEMMSLLLMAQATGKSIGVGYSGSCGEGFPAIEARYVYFANQN